MKARQQQSAATSLRAKFREAQAADGADFELFDSIVKNMPHEVAAFFDTFENARANMTMPQEVAVLNAVAKDEFAAARDGGAPACLMRWFEVFRDIYIARRLRAERDGRPRVKNPNDFSTFARTFEPLALLPDFWFANDRLVAGADVRALAHPVRLAFERYLYSFAGAGAWGAMDWELGRYVDTRIYAPLRKRGGDVLRRIAALALTLRGIVMGEMGLHVEERDDVTLPLTGLSNAAGQKIPLLKYYHYDRFTQLSYTREHEFALDPNAGGSHAAFEERWLGLAVISDFILKEANAHSTVSAASRAALESFSRCLARVKDKIGSGAHGKVVAAVQRLQDVADSCAAVGAARLPDAAALLARLGIEARVMSPEHYLSAAGLDTAEKFWRAAMPVMCELDARINACHETTVATYTQRQMERALVGDKDVQLRYLEEVCNYGQGNELLSTFGGGGLREIMKTCLASEKFEFQYGVAADVLLGDGPRKDVFSVLSARTGQFRDIPLATLFKKGERARFGEWIRDVWTRSAGGGRDYGKLDFAAIVRDADRLWTCYFSDESACVDRWMLSLHVAIGVFSEMQRNGTDRFSFERKGSGEGRCSFRSRIWERHEVNLMLERLNREKAMLEKAGVWTDDVGELRKRVEKAPEDTLAKATSRGDAKTFVIYAVLARLMVATASAYPEIWSNRSELFSLVTHILCATMHDVERAFPWHLGIFNDSYLRIGRTHGQQQNVVDQVVDHNYGDAAERQVLLMFLAHYLRQAENPCGVLDAIDANEQLGAYFGRDRMRFLRHHFE